ncbi:DUF3253 domain-containing protein [Sulfitobacter sp. HNIBRBA3233]|uniref:DUF3253 domain-containing protein n=1 Tax=Sulfitobacter marinivivus TaxID=3158558 RepID=UPI0032DF9E1A
MRQINLRGAGKSVCPSEVARGLSPVWRDLMQPVRVVAADLAEGGRIEVVQKGVRVDALTARGPIRLRKPQESD